MLGRNNAGRSVFANCLHGLPLLGDTQQRSDQQHETEAPDEPETPLQQLWCGPPEVYLVCWSHRRVRLRRAHRDSFDGDARPMSQGQFVPSLEGGIDERFEVHAITFSAIGRTDVTHTPTAIILAGQQGMTVRDGIIKVERNVRSNTTTLMAAANQITGLVQAKCQRRLRRWEHRIVSTTQAWINGDDDFPILYRR